MCTNMTQKQRIILYPDSVRRLLTEIVPGLSSRKYDAIISPSGYDLTEIERGQDPALRLRVVGAGIDGLTPDNVLTLTREACFSACTEWGIKSSAITLDGDPRGLDVEKLRGELELLKQMRRHSYNNLHPATIREGIQLHKWLR